MREETKEAARRFFEPCGLRYSDTHLKNDYLAEIAGYSDDSWEAPQRAARLAAAVKRYKTSEMLRFIFDTIANDLDPDLTPLTVKRLCNTLFGRTGSQSLIVAVFGERGRQNRSTDSSWDAVENMAARYRHAAEQHWSATLAEIERAKRTYKAGVKASRNTG